MTAKKKPAVAANVGAAQKPAAAPAGATGLKRGGSLLDRSKDFGEVHAGGAVKYEQGGKFFDADGKQVDIDGKPIMVGNSKPAADTTGGDGAPEIGGTGSVGGVGSVGGAGAGEPVNEEGKGGVSSEDDLAALSQGGQ